MAFFFKINFLCHCCCGFIDGSVEFGSFLGAQATQIRSKSLTFGHRLDLPHQTVGFNEVALTCCIWRYTRIWATGFVWYAQKVLPANSTSSENGGMMLISVRISVACEAQRQTVSLEVWLASLCVLTCWFFTCPTSPKEILCLWMILELPRQDTVSLFSLNFGPKPTTS